MDKDLAPAGKTHSFPKDLAESRLLSVSSMYIPPAFAVADHEQLARFMAANSFATLISCSEAGPPFASHVPLLYDPEPKPAGRLLGHLAHANPQWRHFSNDRKVLAIFHGPHAYISPRWYSSSPAVPTWNYAVVHATGSPMVFTEEERLEALVRRMVRFYEAGNENPWPGDLPPEFLKAQIKAIVGIEILVTHLEGKFKLGQNRPPTDRACMLAALSESERVEDRRLAEFMKQDGVPKS